VRPGGANRWTVTVCGADTLGALSVVAGLFTAWRFDILRGDVFTLPLPPPRPGHGRAGRRGVGFRRPAAGPRPPTRLLLDVFEVQALGGAGPPAWQQFREDLAALVRLPAAGE